jgi:hypothetical protein
MRPTECPRCALTFHRQRLLQAEARHVAATEGPGAARFLVDEALEDEHASHVVAGSATPTQENNDD